MPESYEELPASRKLPEWTDQVDSIADLAKWILGGITAVLFLLLVIGFIRRGIKKGHSNKAMDHLDGANYRDYGTQPKRRHRSEVQSGSDSAPRAEAKKPTEAESTAQDSELMAETLKRLYHDAPAGESGTEAAVSAEKMEEAGKDPQTQAEAAESAASGSLSATDAARRRRNK